MYILTTCYILGICKSGDYKINNILKIFLDPKPSKLVNQSLSRKKEEEELETHLQKINVLIDEGDKMEYECRSMTGECKNNTFN